MYRLETIGPDDEYRGVVIHGSWVDAQCAAREAFADGVTVRLYVRVEAVWVEITDALSD